MSSTNLACTSARPHLALHAGGDLEPALAEQVEAHLVGCAACRAELVRAQLGRQRIAMLAQSSLDGLESVDLWPALRQRLISERERASERREPVAEERDSVHAASRRVGSRLRRVGWLALPLAAAAALLLMFNRGEAPLIVPAGSPPSALPAAALAANSGVDMQAPQPTPQGLRRAAPGDERLRDSARPMDPPSSGLLRRGDPGSPNALAGDDGLR